MESGILAIATVVGLVGLGLWNGYKEYREYKMRKQANLLPNPQRCEDHEQRLRKVEQSTIEAHVHFQAVREDIKELKSLFMDKAI